MKTNNKNKIIGGLTTLVILAGLAGMTATSLAAETTTTDKTVSTTTKATRAFKRTPLTQVELDKMKAEREAKQTAINTAINSGDYSAWKTAVGENCPMLKKITEANFAKYAEAQKLRQQADAIMKELGLNNGLGEKGGLGLGFGRGGHKINN